MSKSPHGPLPPVSTELIPAATSATYEDIVQRGREEGGLPIIELDPAERFDLHVSRPSGLPALVFYVPRHYQPKAWLYFIHGGGMVSGGSQSRDMVHVLDLAAEAGLGVVEPDYPLAPEHPFPAALDACVAGLAWLRESGAQGIEPHRIIAGGHSAGAGLAAAVALRLRSDGTEAVAGLLLEAAMLDDRCDTISMHQVENNLLPRTWDDVLPGYRGTDQVPLFAAPARATDLAGLPPVFLDVGAADFFRDEVVAFASQIWASGGRADLHVWEGGTHAMEISHPKADVVARCMSARAAWLVKLIQELGD